MDLDIISRNQLKLIQDYVNYTQLPSDVGRIPMKIESGFAGFTADQFKNWVILYSIPSLYGLLPPRHLECWRHFVLACRLLCKQSLTDRDVHLVDALLLQFCKKVEELYGERSITPNMHMHGHLKEVLVDFGPVFEFWLFSFERYNGILGSQPNSNRLIEPQLLCRFLRDNFSFGCHLPEEFSDDFHDLMPSLQSVGSVKDTISPDNSSDYILASKHTLGTFTADEYYHDVTKSLCKYPLVCSK